VPAHDVAEPRDVVDVALDQRRAQRRPAMAGGQVVVDDDVAACAAEEFRRVAADVAGAAGDENGSQVYLPIEKYVKPWVRIVSFEYTFRPSKITGVRINFRILPKSGSRNSFHSVTSASASAPVSAS